MTIENIRRSAEAIDEVKKASIEHDGINTVVSVRASEPIDWREFVESHDVTASQEGQNPFGEFEYKLCR